MALDQRCVILRWEDYREKDRVQGKTRHKTMTLDTGEFMPHFLQRVLPGSFHRILHYGLLANCNRSTCPSLARQLL